jgi:hypothetical protein
VFQDPKKETEKRKEQKIKESQRQFLQTQYGYCLLHGVILGILFLFSLFCFSFYIYAALSFFRIFFGNLPKLSCTSVNFMGSLHLFWDACLHLFYGSMTYAV